MTCIFSLKRFALLAQSVSFLSSLLSALLVMLTADIALVGSCDVTAPKNCCF
jgi:hypothetical protein